MVDGIHGEGSIRLFIQLFYDNDNLKYYFKDLYDNNKNQLVNLKIELNDFKNILDDYDVVQDFILVHQNSNKSAFKERQWFMNKEIFKYFPFKQGFIPVNIVVDDIKAKAKIRIIPKLSFKKNKELQDYLKENEGKKVEVKIKTDKFNF